MAEKQTKAYTKETRQAAKLLYRRGFTVSEISEELCVAPRSIYTWREDEKWDDLLPSGTIEETLARRICCLADRENKSKDETFELDLLLNRLESLCIALAKARQIDKADPGEFTKRSPSKGDGKEGKKKKGKNEVEDIDPAKLDEIREKLFWKYQKEWYRAGKNPDTRRNRFILKSRQIGATFFFAWEALEDAIRTGDNQIFLSASRDQAKVFRAYIIMFATKYLEIELTGNPIILSNGAELRFLSTNSRTAQSYHGHLYLDEVFWIQQFAKIWKVASAMAAHKRWRRTLFSTPSALSHEAYVIWSGQHFNKGKSDKHKADFDLSRSALKNGMMGADKFWRHMVTVKDAEYMGCDLFDIDELKLEYSESDFANLFMCEFIDDAESVFKLSMLLACGVESADWADYEEDSDRPFGNKPVTVGYDPSRSKDNASLALLAVPIGPRDKWRVLRRWDFHAQSFNYQAARIKEICQSHNVVYMGIDTSGMGYGVYELVTAFYPQAEPITYSVQVKNQLVVKGLDVMQNKRLEYDAGDKSITQAFMMIRQTTSGSGQIVYVAQRSGETGHADPAWAILHALKHEPIDAESGGSSTAVISN